MLTRISCLAVGGLRASMDTICAIRNLEARSRHSIQKLLFQDLVEAGCIVAVVFVPLTTPPHLVPQVDGASLAVEDPGQPGLNRPSPLGIGNRAENIRR